MYLILPLMEPPYLGSAVQVHSLNIYSIEKKITEKISIALKICEKLLYKLSTVSNITASVLISIRPTIKLFTILSLLFPPSAGSSN
jgi:DNA-binding XRE family transcriptional regulator